MPNSNKSSTKFQSLLHEAGSPQFEDKYGYEPTAANLMDVLPVRADGAPITNVLMGGVKVQKPELARPVSAVINELDVDRGFIEYYVGEAAPVVVKSSARPDAVPSAAERLGQSWSSPAKSCRPIALKPVKPMGLLDDWLVATTHMKGPFASGMDPALSERYAISLLRGPATPRDYADTPISRLPKK